MPQHTWHSYAALFGADQDGNLLTAQLVQGPTNGQLTFNPATGQFSYRGFGNFHGQDTFTYRAFDGELMAVASKARAAGREIVVTRQLAADPLIAAFPRPDAS